MATILIVDDHPTMRFLLKSILTNEGHAVLEAHNGQAALASLADSPEVALLVTDVDMPVMNGLELLCALTFREDLPKLVISGATAAPPLAGLNVSGFFSKPLNLAQFKHTVARLVNPQAAAT